MVDTFCILFSTIGCLVVIFRAVLLDRSVPWFQPEKAPVPKAAADAQVPRSGWRTNATAARRKGPA
jgi:hypothetical protein